MTRPNRTGGDADSTSGEDGSRLDANAAPKLMLHKQKWRAGFKTASLAVTLLLASTLVTGAQALTADDIKEAERKFNAAAEASDPKDVLNKDEFQVYDLSMGRADSAA